MQVRTARRGEPAVGLLPRPAGGDGVQRQAGLRVGQRVHVAAQARVQPRLPRQDVLRVDREPLLEREPGLGRAGGELLDLRPGALGVHVVGGQRRDPAPVVDAGPDHQAVLVADEVRGRLDAGPGAEHEPGDRDRRGQLVQVGVGHAAHGRVRLGAEVLHDDFLHGPVLAGDLPDGEDRLGAVGDGLADADQDARGERHVGAAGVLQHAQPYGRVLVGRAVVGLALLLEQPPGGRLKHHAHGRGHRLEPLQVAPGHDARVKVREQPRLLQDADRHRAHVGQRVVVPVGVQPLFGLVPAVLGAVAQREQGLLAPHGGALAGDVQHLVGAEEGGGELAGRRGERAVAAPVAAQPGQGDEDLAAVGDDPLPSHRGQPRVPHAAGVFEEPVQVGSPGMQQNRGLRHVERLAVPGPGQRPPHRGVCGVHVHGTHSTEPPGPGTRAGSRRSIRL